MTGSPTSSSGIRAATSEPDAAGGGRATPTRRTMLRGGFVLTMGSLITAIASFARNIIIARLISVEDFGIAATLAMTMSLIEMASNLALDRLLVQAPDGDTPQMLATAHAFQVVRGVLATVVLFLLAGPIAALFGIPEIVWAFRVMALVPLIRSFLHLDSACQQRGMNFGASVWIDTVPQALATLAAAPLALWLGDYRVMLLVVVGQVTMMVLVSHVVAERPYRWAWDREIIGRMLRFGWPLLINGLLMFAIFQGDKAIVGASFSMEDLGWYTVAFALAMVPCTVIARIVYSFFMPLLSAVQGDASRFQQRATLCAQCCMLLGALVSIGFLVAGPSVLLLVYGERYGPGTTVVGILGMMHGFRIAKAGPAIVAMSQADTTSPLIANIVRCCSVIMAIAFVWLDCGIVAIAICGVFGELLAALVGIGLLRYRLSLRITPMLGCFAVTSVAMLLIAVSAGYTFRGEQPWFEVSVGMISAISATGLLSLMFPEVVALVARARAAASGTLTVSSESPPKEGDVI